MAVGDDGGAGAVWRAIQDQADRWLAEQVGAVLLVPVDGRPRPLLPEAARDPGVLRPRLAALGPDDGAGQWEAALTAAGRAGWSSQMPAVLMTDRAGSAEASRAGFGGRVHLLEGPSRNVAVRSESVTRLGPGLRVVRATVHNFGDAAVTVAVRLNREAGPDLRRWDTLAVAPRGELTLEHRLVAEGEATADTLVWRLEVPADVANAVRWDDEVAVVVPAERLQRVAVLDLGGDSLDAMVRDRLLAALRPTDAGVTGLQTRVVPAGAEADVALAVDEVLVLLGNADPAGPGGPSAAVREAVRRHWQAGGPVVWLPDARGGGLEQVSGVFEGVGRGAASDPRRHPILDGFEAGGEALLALLPAGTALAGQMGRVVGGVPVLRGPDGLPLVVVVDDGVSRLAVLDPALSGTQGGFAAGPGWVVLWDGLIRWAAGRRGDRDASASVQQLPLSESDLTGHRGAAGGVTAESAVQLLGVDAGVAAAPRLGDPEALRLWPWLLTVAALCAVAEATLARGRRAALAVANRQPGAAERVVWRSRSGKAAAWSPS
jgi:hypothetical protein